MLALRFGELDNSLRLSMILGTVSACVQLFFLAPVVSLIFVGFDPVIFVEYPFALIYLIFWVLVILTPFLLFAATLTLLFAPLTRKSRGILGYLLFLGGAIPAMILTPEILRLLS